jgi:hypothetical protein
MTRYSITASRVCYRMRASVLVAIIVLLGVASPSSSQQCGSCIPDPESPTGASMFCHFGGGSGLIPCLLDEPELPPVLDGADLNVTTDEMPICNQGSVQHWNQTVDETLGVYGYEYGGGANIGFAPAEKFAAQNNNRFPLDGRKHTLCGTLHRFSTFDGPFSEMDWNNFIIPSPSFMYLYTDALPFRGGEGLQCIDDNWSTCGDTEECVEVEVTPHQNFWENPWFRRSTGDSPLENADGNGQPVCTYGPWVRECLHGHKPEIHPSELLWWKEREMTISETVEFFWLMQLHDASHRFDDEGNFDFGNPIFSDPPEGWKPWAGAPRMNGFNVAFALNPSFERVVFDLGQAADLNWPEFWSSKLVRTQDLALPGIPPDDTGRDRHRIRYNGQDIVQARELQRSDGEIAIRFVGVCRDAADTRLQGYLSIITAVGFNEGNEGYHVLFASKSTSRGDVFDEDGDVFERLKRLAKPLAVTLSTRALTDTLRRTVSDGHIQLVGDLLIDLKSEPGIAADARRVISVDVVSGRPTGFRSRIEGAPAAVARGDRLSVPLFGTETLEVVLESGEVLRTGLGSVALAAMPAEIPVHHEPAPEAWPAFAAAADPKFVTPEPPLHPRHVPEWRVEAAPTYAAVKDGEPSLEDESPWVEEINSAVADGEARQMERLFGTTQPFQTEWQFEAVNLSTRERIPVAVDQPRAGGGVRVETMPGEVGRLSVPDAAIRVEFPPGASDPVYYVSATALVRDTFGNSTQAHFEVWSHFLLVESEADIDALVAGVADLAEVSGRLLGYASRPAEPLEPVIDFTAQDPRLRRGRIVVTYARAAAMDGRITVGELENLVRAARLFGGEE